MADGDLTSDDAVRAAVLRPLTTEESESMAALIADVSAQLRNKFRAIDTRIAAYTTNASDPAGINPAAVSGMLARVIKRALVNPKGLWSRTDTEGPFARSETYPGARAGGSAAVSLGAVVTDADIDELLPTSFVRPGTIHLHSRHPRLCP